MSRPVLEEFGSYHAWLVSLEGYREQVRSYSFLPPRPGEPAPYAGRYAEWLDRLGIAPYRHQAEGLARVEAGEDVVVATPTASGKSLVYQLPTLAAVEGGGTALYLFPTKALARDQLQKLRGLAGELGLEPGLIAPYDGDTPAARRGEVRDLARCVLTNPDMLHYGILPYHERWARLLGRLELVVLDELHAYRGVMGTHVANIARRLLRVAEAYGAKPRLIAASATIGNPAEHARALTGRAFAAVTEDGAPAGAREFVFWEPPPRPGLDGRRRSATAEAAWLAAEFVRRGLKSLFFCNSRKGAELLRRYAAGQLEPEQAERLESYRAGYTAEDRRRIEDAFKGGDLTVLAATSALELGVDIGAVDAVVLVGYPGSLTSLWQRAGRAGRAGRRSLTVLLPGNDPLDEYYLHHPELITEGRVEDAVADPHNSEVHPAHVVCAAAERPVREGEELLAPWLRLDEVQGLVPGGEGWRSLRRYPHRRVAVRGSGGGRVRLEDGFGGRIGVADRETAVRELHPGAVYLHRGDTFLVARLDLDAGLATLVPHIESWYTQTRMETDVEVLAAEHLFGRVSVGRVRVATRVTGYVKKRYLTEAVLDEVPLELPEISYPTQALWFRVSDVAGAVPPAELPSAMHALEHTLIGLLPAFVLCERADVGGVSYPLYPPTGEPTVFVYDGYPGGVGYARAGASLFPRWLAAARDLLADCPCREGCPRCVLSPKCGNGNQYLDKATARRLAEALLAAERPQGERVLS